MCTRVWQKGRLQLVVEMSDVETDIEAAQHVAHELWGLFLK
jgi:hypothetical protein